MLSLYLGSSIVVLPVAHMWHNSRSQGTHDSIEKEWQFMDMYPGLSVNTEDTKKLLNFWKQMGDGGDL